MLSPQLYTKVPPAMDDIYIFLGKQWLLTSVKHPANNPTIHGFHSCPKFVELGFLVVAVIKSIININVEWDMMLGMAVSNLIPMFKRLCNAQKDTHSLNK